MHGRSRILWRLVWDRLVKLIPQIPESKAAELRGGTLESQNGDGGDTMSTWGRTRAAVMASMRVAAAGDVCGCGDGGD